MVIWFVGISGVGKTTLANFFYKKLKDKKIIHIDGDKFRKVFNNDLKYSLKDRNINAKRLTSLVKYLSDQDLNVIVSANLTSERYRIWCRKNIKDYFEVFIDVPFELLKKRDKKNLYNSKRKNIVGVDIKYKKPSNYNYKIINIGNKYDLLNHYNNINSKLKKSFKFC
jgi:adenylylsulfate kinase-like enzyme